MIFEAWYFARDDRVYKAFLEALEPIAEDIRTKCGKRLRWQVCDLLVESFLYTLLTLRQIRVIQNVMEGRSTSLRVGVQCF